MLLVPPDCVKVPVPEKPTFSDDAVVNWPLPLRLYVPLLPAYVAEIEMSLTLLVPPDCVKVPVPSWPTYSSCRQTAAAAEAVRAAAAGVGAEIERCR